jgi:hypothetical protein
MTTSTGFPFVQREPACLPFPAKHPTMTSFYGIVARSNRNRRKAAKRRRHTPLIGVPRGHWEHCRRDHFSPLLARIEFFGDRLRFEFALSATPWRRNRRSGQRGQP